ncbi:MAG: hypothetical protein ACRCT1_14485, partial [Microcoleaceae cyanobacterium]
MLALRTFLITKKPDFTASSFFLLPSSFFLLLYNKYESNHSWKIMVQQIDAPPTIISPHPLDRVFEDLAYLVKSLETELDVAPHDRAAHQDLLRRIQKIAETALTIPDEVWPKSVNLPE